MSAPPTRDYAPLNALRAFEVAARYQSISRAAEELFVTQAAVSQQIALLEDRLEVSLFTRHHRRVELTDEGRSLALVLQQSFENIYAAVRKLKRNRNNRVLKLVLVPTLAIRWMMPRLARFHEQWPDIDLQITTSIHPVDFVNDDVDFSILFQDQLPKDVEGMPIIEEVLLPVCSPKLCDPRAMELADLSKHTLLHSMNRLLDWGQWFNSIGMGDFKPTAGELFFGNSYLAYQAAIDGLGISMAQHAFVEQDLAEGRLIAPFAQTFPTGRTYNLTYLGTRKHLPNIEIFRSWITSEAKRSLLADAGAH